MDQDEIWRRQGKVINRMVDRIIKKNPGMPRIRARKLARETRKGRRIMAVGVTSRETSYLKRASTGSRGG
ncbi:hypothetical protein [Lactobacillus intestinalis]|uniref:hypothetical protein n=1 Tax=Lactobacillus intestinalis TaxID=151781 RepID=UPI002729D0A8|nr:hypothetical protein [Lactobacillus intestinalis]